MVEHQALGLPAALVRRFEEWVLYYDDRHHENRPFDLNSFNETGMQLSKDLQACLGKDVDVTFWPEHPTIEGESV